MTITWDAHNANEHFHKHHIYFTEAATVFDDPFSITSLDNHHGEPRFTRIGKSESNHLLRVTYSVEAEEIRVISARKASPANMDDFGPKRPASNSDAAKAKGGRPKILLSRDAKTEKTVSL